MPPPCVRCQTDRGESVQGCAHCQMRDKHRHIVLRDRFDRFHGEVVVCEPCLARLGWGSRTLMAALMAVERASA